MRRIFWALTAVLLSSLCALAQSNFAVLSGSITDPQSRAVSGATIELVSAETGAVRRATTNEQGLYQIPGLQPGDYKLTISAMGFTSQRQTLRLEVAQKLAVDIRLPLESHKEVVEVSSLPGQRHQRRYRVRAG